MIYLEGSLLDTMAILHNVLSLVLILNQLVQSRLTVGCPNFIPRITASQRKQGF
jgi:hypothetical protein